MATVGKWGVTRDDNGELSDIWAWPWYWRYPVGIGGGAVTAWLALQTHGHGWTPIILVTLGGIMVLSVMYELACLGIALVVFGGLGWAILHAIPESWTTGPKAIAGAALILAIWAAWSASEANRKADSLGIRLQSIARAMDEQVQSEIDRRDDIYGRMGELRQRVKSLESDDIDWG